MNSIPLMSSSKPIAVTAALVLALAAMPAAAQGVKELRSPAPAELIPPGQLASALAKPQELTDMEDEGSGTVAVMSDIAVTPAMNISLDTLGIYDDKSGGLAFSVWEGSDYARVKLLLEHVPHTIPSPTVRQLVARLLLSTARPPQSDNIQQNVFRQRILTLLNIDEAAQAQRLLEMVPQDLRTADTAQLEFTAHLLKGEADWVCDRIADALGRYAGKSPQWQKYSIFCLARAGDEARTQLALDVLAEQKVELDPGFLSLVDVMLERTDKVATRFSAPLSLDNAALIALSGKDAFPEGYLADTPLPVARLVKDNAGFSDAIRKQAEQRLAAAIAAERLSRERAIMQGWFRGQFALAPERPFDFDRAAKEMREKGGSTGDTADLRRRYRFYTMLQALGFGELRATVQWDKTTFHDKGRIHVSPILRSETASAVDKELTGESILLLAMAVGQVDDLSDVDDASIADMVQALVQLGFTAEAQALAAEAMTALY